MFFAFVLVEFHLEIFYIFIYIFKLMFFAFGLVELNLKTFYIFLLLLFLLLSLVFGKQLRFTGMTI